MGFFDWLTGRGHGEQQQAADQPVPAPLPSPPGPDEINASMKRVEALVETGVPTAVSSRVHRVTNAVRKTLPRIDNIGWGSADAYSLMATATDYLPEAIGAYLRLPRDWADSRPIEGGKTALMLLIDQLDLLGVTMEKIYDAVNQFDANALITHGRFLQEKFGAPSASGTVTMSQVPVAPDRSTNPLDL